LVATILILKFLFHSFHVDPQYESVAQIALLIAGLNMASILPLSVFSSVLASLERFELLSAVTIVGELARAALVVICLRRGYGLVGLAVVCVLITAGEYGAMAVISKRLYPPLKIALRFVNWATFKELGNFGIFRFIWIVGNQLIFYSDSVVIGIFLGPGAITYYAIAGSVINYGRNVVSLVTDTLYPAASRLDAKQDLAGLQKLLILGTRMSLLVSLPLCLGFIFLGQQFITLWMGKAYISSAVFLVVLTIPQFTAMPQYVSALVLSGMAKHKVLAYMILLEGVANLVLSVILVRKIGLIGVAWGTAIPDLICTAVFVPLYTLRTLKLGMRKYFVEAWLRPLICTAPVIAICYGFSVAVESTSWAIFGAEVLTICGVYGLMAFLLCLDSRQRAMTRRKVWSFVHREEVVHEA
jgi:O-antigen/teichoic acid export membrane protein